MILMYLYLCLYQWLLVLWKTLLICWGGARELKRVKALARDLAGLPNDTESEGKCPFVLSRQIINF